MIDFGMFQRQAMSPDSRLPINCDTFVSSFNLSERVQLVSQRVHSSRAVWLLHDEYRIPSADIPKGTAPVLALSKGDEAEDLADVMSFLGSPSSCGDLVIDCTGMMRPHLALLIPMLFAYGHRRFTLLYSEPRQYTRKERTQFSLGDITEVRPIRGCEGSHSTNTSYDLLVIGAGYDSQLIAHVAEHKKAARKVQMLGLADMYQENMLRSREAEESLGESLVPRRDYFAPANDPFAVAGELQKIVTLEKSKRRLSNLYLCPLATKPQVIGFALYHYLFWRGREGSIVFPFASRYEAETSKGCSRVWAYTIEEP